MKNKFVSRAGQKLEHALEIFKIDVKNKICADFGCSTGGFVDCVLQNGAKKVYAIDTGYGVLEWKLRQDDRVIVMEKTNALYAELPEKVDFVSVDVGWTKQKLIIPKVLEFLKPNGTIVSLLKTHYESEKQWLYKGKVKEEFLETIVNKVKTELETLGVKIKKIIPSPVTGKKGGNIEYLIWIVN